MRQRPYDKFVSQLNCLHSVARAAHVSCFGGCCDMDQKKVIASGNEPVASFGAVVPIEKTVWLPEHFSFCRLGGQAPVAKDSRPDARILLG